MQQHILVFYLPKETNIIIYGITTARNRLWAPGRMEGVKIATDNWITSDESKNKNPNIGRNISIVCNVARPYFRRWRRIRQENLSTDNIDFKVGKTIASNSINVDLKQEKSGILNGRVGNNHVSERKSIGHLLREIKYYKVGRRAIKLLTFHWKILVVLPEFITLLMVTIIWR